MKKCIVLLLSTMLFGKVSQAQDKEVNSYADLPVINYSTKELKAGNETKTRAWMKSIAASELKHMDSVSKKFTIKNSDVALNYNMGKLFCNFILADWKNTAFADTLFRSSEEIPPAFKKAGLSQLSSYAKASMQPSADFNKNFMQFFIESMKPLTEEEKEQYLGYIISLSRDAPKKFEERINKVKTKPNIADTSVELFSILGDYVYGQVKSALIDQIAAYLNEGIKGKFTRADTLRGSINAERAWWNVLHYAITVRPDYVGKTIVGSNDIRYQVMSDNHPLVMQIDLQEPLIIDSIIFETQKLKTTKDGNAWHVAVPAQKKSSINDITVYYHGAPHVAVNPPWDGGWIFTKDSTGAPWMSVACEGTGASIWYPCKDHLSDEPDNGASLSMIIPDTLVGVANGRLQTKINNNDGTVTYTWGVVNPINNYDIIPYIGKYVNYSEVYNGEKARLSYGQGKLDVNYWVLNYNLDKAKAHMVPEVHRMLKSHEYWMGPYPFYEDGYKIVDAPHLGMEHQSAIAYGNKYMNGYLGQDMSGSGWGLKWDYIIVHESGHEWFGNNITDKDIADMWVHEGFTAYSETLFTEYYYGKKAGNEYLNGTRSGIQNILPIIGYYNVNDDVSARNGDMYPKGSNMLHTIRHSMNNDSLFREILRGLNKTFYHQTVSTSQIENYISDHAGFDYSKVFDQYLRNIQIPQLEIYFAPGGKEVYYRYTNCIDGFNLPLILKNGNDSL
ncbi:MAG: M1 family metallopeptidase, partial [Ginsengibacter sp.]